MRKNGPLPPIRSFLLVRLAIPFRPTVGEFLNKKLATVETFQETRG